MALMPMGQTMPPGLWETKGYVNVLFRTCGT